MVQNDTEKQQTSLESWIIQDFKNGLFAVAF